MPAVGFFPPGGAFAAPFRRRPRQHPGHRSGSARLRPLIAETTRRGLCLAFTTRLAKTAYLHPSGSRTP
ncbi:hypothetical protein ACFVH9_31350 [Streptomyces hirsutus]|uniref:hypothetical protein n=1 Tax=Streptomyces hirsutus TaxID=35620 RepID=UPI00363FD44A